jgi:molecular chaperone GrpE
MAEENSSNGAMVDGTKERELDTFEPIQVDDEESSRLHRELDEAQSLAEERLVQLKRCRADLDNTLKIAAREREEYVKYASMKLVSKLLCVLDSLEQASKHDEGSKVLYQQLLNILKGEGLEPIEAVGNRFDPYRHEAVMQTRSEELEEDYISQEIQRGYTLNSRVIRFSKVAVVKR